MIADLFDSFTPLSDLLTFNEAITKYGDMKSALQTHTDLTSIDANRLWAMLVARFGEWKIYRTVDDTTITAFKDRLAAYFDRYCYYYNEYLAAYNTTIDMLDGRKTVIAYDTTQTRQEGGSDGTEYSGHTKNVTSGENQYYDLPRQSTNENRPSSKDSSTGDEDTTSTSTSKTAYGHTDESKRGGTVTRTGDADVIDLKQRYLKLIQDVYYEFAGRFEPLFVPMFDESV